MTFAPQKEEAVGTINNIVSRSIVQRVYNDGDNTYLTIQQESRNSLPIVSTASTLIVPLTNPNVDFVQFDKSFIRLHATITLDVSDFDEAIASSTVVTNADGTTTTITADTDAVTGGIYLFVGLKNSSDFISEYAIYHKGKQISGTLQSNATVESFLYHSSRSAFDTQNRKGIHSVAEKVAEGDDTSYVGQYISLYQLQTAAATTAKTLDVDLNIDIPFNDVLIFQQFQTYPSALFGDLEIRFKVNPNALVCLQCNPYATLRQKNIKDGTNATTKNLMNTYATEAVNYTRDYTQLGDSFVAISHAMQQTYADLSETNETEDQTTIAIAAFLNGMEKLTMTTKSVSLSYNTIALDQCYATIIGYRAKPDSLEKMRQKFEKLPFVKFSQNINYLQFASKPTTNINMTQQVYLNNTTDMILLFPTTSHEAGGTVYKNPMLQNLSLTAMNRKFPETGFDTTSPEYLHIQLNSTRGTPQKEVADSLSTKRWDTDGKYNPPFDRTSFFTAFKVERPTAMGLICDGLDSKGYQVPIRLMAQPKYATANDLYCYKSENTSALPPPILITVNDSYFIFNSKDGGQCIYSNRPFNETVATFMSQ